MAFDILVLMRRSNCSAPIHHPYPNTPGDIIFFWVGPVFLLLYFYLIIPYNHFNTFIFQCPALFLLHFSVSRPSYHTHLSFDPGAPVGDGARTI